MRWLLALHVSLAAVFVLVSPFFLLAGLALLPVYHLATDRRESAAPRAGALVCGLMAAAALVWWEYGWWFEMSTMDKGAYDVELTLRRILFTGALVLTTVYVTVTVILHGRRKAVHVPARARVVDLVVLASPALVLLWVDDGQSRLAPGWTGWLALAVAGVGAATIAAVPRPAALTKEG
ncbi:hypothetical protein [Actinomadura rudentiformis]|uniref:Uncharacterized protein n=1 Tax=Actinomadura rudentiformis TaxID=359158 RepID=A0A6H9YYU8_9ACTN|nr:hypothetical protein [Actinomadura rudentiformis]KAB2351723.1 hypothetical protein F8566_05795 [Actinomadura rudentiformis]